MWFALSLGLCFSVLDKTEEKNNFSQNYTEETKQIAKKMIQNYKIHKEKKNHLPIEKISFPLKEDEQKEFIKKMISPYYEGDINIEKMQPGSYSKFVYMIYAKKKDTSHLEVTSASDSGETSTSDSEKTPIFVLKEISDRSNRLSDESPVSQMERLSNLPYNLLDRWKNFGIVFPEKLFLDPSMTKTDEDSHQILKHEGFALLHVAKGEEFVDYFNQKRNWEEYTNLGKAYMNWILKIDERINPRSKHESFFDIKAYTHGDFHLSNIRVKSEKDHLNYYLLDTGTISQIPHTLDYILNTDMLRMFFLLIDSKSKHSYQQSSLGLKKFLSGCAESLSEKYNQDSSYFLEEMYKKILNHMDSLIEKEFTHEKSDDFMTKDIFYIYLKEYEDLRKYFIKIFENPKL